MPGTICAEKTAKADSSSFICCVLHAFFEHERTEPEQPLEQKQEGADQKNRSAPPAHKDDYCGFGIGTDALPV
jgi:hypothetical protein